MGKIVISQNMSLDGVVEDPTGEEGFRHGGWFDQLLGSDREAWAQVEFHEALDAEALLLGRRSDEYFGSRWNGRGGDWAARLNSLPKYVVSSSLETPVWANSRVLRDDAREAAAKLRQEMQGEIVVYASRRLVQELIEADLVDELRLIVFPVVLGDGERLFGQTSQKKPVRLLAVRPVGAGLTLLRYEMVR